MKPRTGNNEGQYGKVMIQLVRVRRPEVGVAGSVRATLLLGVKSAIAALVLIMSFAAVSSAQTLARPGWAGSGLNVQPWWKHAVIYEIDARSFQDSDGDGVGDLKGIAQRLDYLKSLGVDAILLDSIAATKPVSANAKPADRTSPIDPALGTVDDFDDLLREASRYNLRVLLSLAKTGTGADANLLPVARFWLSRGVAGFYLGAGSELDAVSSLHRLVSTFAGQRIIITDANLASAAQPSPGGLVMASALLSINAPTASSSTNFAAPIRLAMEQSQGIFRSGMPLFATDGRGVARSVDRFGDKKNAAGIAKIIGTVLLLDRSASMIYQGQELGLPSSSGDAVAMPWGPAPVAEKPEIEAAAAPAAPQVSAQPVTSEAYVPYVAPTAAAKAVPICGRCIKELIRPAAAPDTASGQDADPKSVLNFYRQLSQLHHGNSALRDGEQIMLNHDDLNALVWVRKPSSVTPLTPAVVLVCNLSDRPLVLPLKAELARLHLRGSFLRTILRSDDAMGSMHLDPISVPPFGVFIGELRY